MLKNNKILIFFIIIFCVLAFFSPKAFASIDYLGKQFPDFPEGFEDAKYQIICYYPNLSRYEIFFWEEDGSYFDTTYINDAGDESSSLYIPGDYKRYSWYPSEGGSSWVVPSLSVDGGAFTYASYIFNFAGYGDESSSGYKIMIYSNFDITIDDTDNCFFYRTPLLRTTTTQSVIGGNIYQEVKKLLITILVVLVSLVGLRKGLKMLLTVLHRS